MRRVSVCNIGITEEMNVEGSATQNLKRKLKWYEHPYESDLASPSFFHFTIPSIIICINTFCLNLYQMKYFSI